MHMDECLSQTHSRAFASLLAMDLSSKGALSEGRGPHEQFDASAKDSGCTRDLQKLLLDMAVGVPSAVKHQVLLDLEKNPGSRFMSWRQVQQNIRNTLWNDWELLYLRIEHAVMSEIAKDKVIAVPHDEDQLRQCCLPHCVDGISPHGVLVPMPSTSSAPYRIRRNKAQEAPMLAEQKCVTDAEATALLRTSVEHACVKHQEAFLHQFKHDLDIWFESVQSWHDTCEQPISCPETTCESQVWVENPGSDLVSKVVPQCTIDGSTTSIFDKDQACGVHVSPGSQTVLIHSNEVGVVQNLATEHIQAVHMNHTLADLRQPMRGPIIGLGTLAKFEAAWSEIDEPPRTGILADLIGGTKFEVVCMSVIMLHILFTFIATNYGMQHLANHHPIHIKTIEWCFTGFYTVELILKLVVHRFYFFVNHDMVWNIFDCILMLVSVLDGLSNVFGGSLGNPSFFRAIRTIRVVRVLRMVRVLRFFTELRLMLNCVIGSFVSLFWSIYLLFCLSMLFATALVQQLTSYLVENRDTITLAQRESIRSSFGSVEQATFSLFRGISGSDWTIYYEIVSKTGWVNSIIFLTYVVIVWLSVTNIITCIFVEKAMKLAQPDLEEMMFSKHKEDIQQADELEVLFSRLDLNHNGTISWKEFQARLQDMEIISYLEISGLAVDDAEMFFKMLLSISGKETVDLESFVFGCMKMKGSAMSIDLLRLGYEMKISHKIIVKMIEDVALQFSELEQKFAHTSASRAERLDSRRSKSLQL